MHEVYADREVMRYIGADGGFSRSIEESERRLQRLIDHQENHGFSLWAVIDRETGSVLGDAGLILFAYRGPEIELGYRLAKAYWGRGYATEAASAWLAYAFETLGLDRVVAVTHPENVGSQRVLEKIGMQREGTTDYDGRTGLLFSASRAP